jgi:hypothetical protein
MRFEIHARGGTPDARTDAVDCLSVHVTHGTRFSPDGSIPFQTLKTTQNT